MNYIINDCDILCLLKSPNDVFEYITHEYRGEIGYAVADNARNWCKLAKEGELYEDKKIKMKCIQDFIFD